MERSGFHRMMKNLDRLKWNVTAKGVLVGIAAGALVVLYRLLIELGTDTAVSAYRAIRTNLAYLPLWAAAIAAAGYLLYRLIRLEPYAKGSGIPQVEGIVLYGMQIKWYTVLAVRFLAGPIASLFGVSLGREGPSIQIGASGAQAVAGKLCGNRLEKNYLITAGASAGLSAAFNAPLSGIMFALEEMHRTFSPNILIAATSAALTADFVSKTVFGLKPVLSYAPIPQLPVALYAVLPILGVLAGLIGAAVNRSLLDIGKLYRKVPESLRPTIALSLALVCGLFLPQVLGGGQELVRLAEEADTGAAFLFLLMAVKLAFTSTSFGSGLPGGIFMPILSIGALAGGLFARVLMTFGIPADYVPLFCVCAMAGIMAGSVKAPVTSILLMAEMTGSIVHLLPVAAVAFIAQLTSDLLGISPIYEVLLGRIRGEQTEEKQRECRNRTIIEMPVEMGSPAADKLLCEIEWPDSALVIAIRRGDQEFVPNGSTVMLPGDYLLLLSAGQRFEKVNHALMCLCRTP